MSMEDNYPMHNDDLTITNENWGTLEIEFYKKVKLIMVDFYDFQLFFY